jgi:hypothetical protein
MQLHDNSFTSPMLMTLKKAIEIPKYQLKSNKNGTDYIWNNNFFSLA